MKQTMTLALLGSLVFTGTAAAQSEQPSVADQIRRRVSRGDTVYIQDALNREIKGEVDLVGDSTLELLVPGARYDVPFADIRRIERPGDTVVSGASIGFAVGALAGSRCGIGGALGVGAMYAVIGALIDAAHHGRTTVYVQRWSSTVSVVPLVGPRRAGIAVALRAR